MTLTDDDARLLARAAVWTGAEHDLAVVARSEGLDFATALLHERLLRVPENAAFLRAVRESQRPAEIPVDLIGAVPGAFHAEPWNTGAAGARVLAIARELDCAAEVIPTASFGALDENARILLDWLARHRGRRIGLVSLSKGGAEVRRALAHPDAAAAFATVSAWVSFSGIVEGTPLIEWLRRRPVRWWSVRLWLWWCGHSARALDDLRYQPDAAWRALPAHLRVVHVCAFPRQRHLAHPWATRGYQRLAPLGPNDGGGILLGDLLKVPGIVCPIWGADHYLMPPWEVRPLLTNIVATALTK